MPKLDETTRKARRDHILAAAYRCFARNGFAGTTMRAICREAELSLGGVYVHFESKEALMAALAEMGRETTRELMVPAAPRKDRTVSELLGALLGPLGSESCIESLRLDLRLWAESLHTPSLTPHVRDAFESVRQPFEDAWRRSRKTGDLPRNVPPEPAARVLLAIFLGLAVQKAIEPDTDIEACAASIRSVLAGTDRRP